MTFGQFALAWLALVVAVVAAGSVLWRRSEKALGPGEQTLQFTPRRKA